MNDQNRIVGIGYNGFPRGTLVIRISFIPMTLFEIMLLFSKGCSDDDLPWGKTSEDRSQTKYMYVCHAEMNAILVRKLLVNIAE